MQLVHLQNIDPYDIFLEELVPHTVQHANTYTVIGVRGVARILEMGAKMTVTRAQSAIILEPEATPTN